MTVDVNNKNLVEALIFAAPEPVGIARLAELINNASYEEISTSITELNKLYEETGRTFRIIHGAGGFRFATRPEFSRWVRKLVMGSSRIRLSRAALETLSLVAYRQPVSRSDIEAVRGVDVGGVLRMLLERKLIQVEGRSPKPGRPLLYATTAYFLRYFGLNSLNDLPQPQELEEGIWSQESSEPNLETDGLPLDESSFVT